MIRHEAAEAFVFMRMLQTDVGETTFKPADKWVKLYIMYTVKKKKSMINTL